MYELISYVDIVNSYEADMGDIDPAFIETKIHESLVLLKAQCPAVKEALNNPDTADRDYLETIKVVVTKAVLRVVRDPAPGFQSETESGYIYQKFATEASANIWFPKEDLAVLGCGRGNRIGTVRTGMSKHWAAPAKDGCGAWVKWW